MNYAFQLQLKVQHPEEFHNDMIDICWYLITGCISIFNTHDIHLKV